MSLKWVGPAPRNAIVDGDRNANGPFTIDWLRCVNPSGSADLLG